MRKATKKRATVKKVAKKAGGRKRAKEWTREDVAMLRKAYRTTPTREIAKKLRRTLASVQAKARSLGLKKPVVKKAAKKKVAKKKAARKTAKRKVAKKKVAKKRPAKKKAAKKKVAKKKTAKKRTAKKRARR